MQGVLATSLVVDKKCCVGRKSEEVLFHENVDMKLKSVSIEHATAGSRQSGAQVIAISEQAGLDVTGHHVRGFASIRRRGPEQTSRDGANCSFVHHGVLLFMVVQ